MSENQDILFSVTAPHFCAGFVVRSGRVILAAPILAWVRDKHLSDSLRYFRNKGYDVTAKALANRIPLQSISR